MSPFFPTRCCGARLSLRAGAFFLGVVSALRAAIAFVLTAALASDPSRLIPRPLLGDDAVDEDAADAVDTDADAVYALRAVFAILAVCSLCQIAGGYLLLHGAHQGMPALLSAWLISAAVSEPLAVAVAVPAATALAALGLWVAGVGALFAALASSALAVYTGVIVYALYRELTTGNPGTEMREPLAASYPEEQDEKPIGAMQVEGP